MQYPFAVTTITGDHSANTYHRTAVAAEHAVVTALRAGIPRVDVRYLRHLVGTFSPVDLDAVVFGDASTFLIRRLEAAIAALGENPAPFPRGRRRQDAAAVLIERCGLSQQDAVKAVAALQEYLR